MGFINNYSPLRYPGGKAAAAENAWKRHRSIYNNAASLDLTDPCQRLKLGFSTFFLNRTNRGGILPFAGPIGGRDQSGKYKIDARFKKDVLIERLKKIASFKNRIIISSKDAVAFLNDFSQLGLPTNKTFIYLDPPYYKRGKELYLNFYSPKDHVTLADHIIQLKHCRWLMTYDDCPEIRQIYSRPQVNLRDFHLRYSIQQPRAAIEIMITPKHLAL